MNSICYNGSDFIQVHINEHIQTFVPLFGLQHLFNDSYSQFKSLKVREEQVQPTENDEFLSTAKYHSSSRAAWSRFTCSVLHHRSMYCHRLYVTSSQCTLDYLKKDCFHFINSMGLIHSTKFCIISSFL